MFIRSSLLVSVDYCILLPPPANSAHTRTIANLCQFLNSDTSIKPDRWSSLSEFADRAGLQDSMQSFSVNNKTVVVEGPAISSLCHMSTALCISCSAEGVASGCGVLVLANYNCNRSRFLASDSHSVHFINAMQPLLKCIFRVINGHNSITSTTFGIWLDTGSG